MVSRLDEFDHIWLDAQDVLHDELDIPWGTIRMWFRNLKVIAFRANIVTIAADSTSQYNDIREKRIDILTKAFSTAIGMPVTLIITYDDQLEKLYESAKKSENAPQIPPRRLGFFDGDDDDIDEIEMPDPIIPTSETGDGYEVELYRRRCEELSRESEEARAARIEEIREARNKALVKRLRDEKAAELAAYDELRQTEAYQNYFKDRNLTPPPRPSSATTPAPTPAPSPTVSRTPIGSTLPPYNFEYTFDNFIVGNSNRFAQAACYAVASNPATSYNPLFIYGPSGLGKTHLLYAITNEVKKKKPDVKIIYIKGEDFTNQFIAALASSTINEFRQKYRNCDMLLIDDIQFIAGKTSTQEEFFHTFNTLYEEHKQIILTSDRPPKDMKTLEDRLKTRFEWGLLADIQPPDLELRIAIIKKKAEQVSITIPEDVLAYLAENLRSNIRQIEGAMKKLGATVFLSGQRITMDTARACISDLLGGEEPVSVTVDKIFAAVYKKYGISKEDLIGQKRSRDIAQARHISIYLIRNITEMSLPNIGKIFGRDHTTIISSIEVVEKRLKNDPMLTLDIADMTKDVTGETPRD